MKIDENAFAEEWVKSWNSHDLDRILSHYANDLEITTPMIKLALGIDTGTLLGKQNVREYWASALQKMPNLHFELKDVTTGVNSIARITNQSWRKWLLRLCFLITKIKSIRL